MREKEPVTFSEWVDKKKGWFWYEAPIMTEAHLLEVDSLKKEVIQSVAYALANGAFNKGLEFPSEIRVSYSRGLVGHALIFDTRGYYKKVGQRYLMMAHASWSYEHDLREGLEEELQEWKSKSLWGYVIHFIRRLMKRSDIEEA